MEDKVHIIQNAIDLAHAMRFPEVRVAILSAMETVNPKVPSTVEAGALCKMADRGQITGGDSRRAARARQRDQPRIGEDQEDRLAGGRPRQRARRARPRGRQHAREEPVFLAGADAAGIVLGARVPIILTSRADSVMTRLASCGIAALVAQARREAGTKNSDLTRWTPSLSLNAGSSSLKFSLFAAARR